MSDFVLSDICCVVVTYNGTKKNIETIKKYQEIFKKMVVIDNHSEDIFLNALRMVVKGASLIANDENLGLGFALNQGLEYAKKQGAKLLLTMDQDSIIEQDAVERLLSGIDLNLGYISVGTNYRKESLQSCKDKSFLISSGNLTLIQAIEIAGGFNSGLFIDCIDIDFSWRLLEVGYKMRIIPDAYIEHKIGEPEESKIFGIRYYSHSPIRFFYIFRNTILISKYHFKYLPFNVLKMIASLILIDIPKLLFLETNKYTKILMAGKGVIYGMKGKSGKYDR